MQANLSKHLQSVLNDPALYSSILSLNNREISELSQSLQAALNVAKNCVLLRCNEETPA